MPTVNVKIADIKDPVVVKVSEMGYIRGQDGFSPTVETEKIDGIERCIVVEDGAGHKWCFLPGAGAEGDVVIDDDSGNQWHMPAGEAESGEIAATDGDGGAWHLPVGSVGRGYRITITDKDGAHVVYVWDGERGADGRQGVDGQPGQDGFSPLVSMTEITGGYRLTITDKNGAHSVNIYNGEESVIFIAEYGTTAQEELDSAYSEGKIIFVKKDGLCRLLTSTTLYRPTPTAEGIRNYTFALYRPDIKQVETVFWLADGRGWTATTASADWQPKITASGILKGDGQGGVKAATAGKDYLAPSALTPYRTATAQDAIDAGKEAAGLGLTGASVGDLVRVNAVDANGKPTSWKHVPLNEIKCNKNLLDNWYFVGGGSQLGDGVFPINQRGQTTYSNAWYGIDRWRIRKDNTAAITLNTQFLSLSGTDTDGILQICKLTNGCTYTVTVLTDNELFTTTFVVTNSNIGGLYRQNSRLAYFYSYTNYEFYVALIRKGSSSVTYNIKAVKLELGSEQTLAHNEGTEENPVWVLNEIPDYGEELRKCQRYFVRINPGAWANIGFTYAANENTCSTLVALPTTMAKNTVVTFNGDLLVKNAVTSTQATGNISGSSVSFSIQTTGLTVREVNTFRAGPNGGYIDISAEH